MKLEIDIPEHHYNNIMALDSVSLGRVPYKGIIMYSINAIKHGKVLVQEPTTKNNLAVDAVSRNAVINQIFYSTDNNGDVVLGSALRERIARLPSVTPQEPQTFKWCDTCREYDQEKHCCHRWSKVIRDTVEEMKQEPKMGHWIDDTRLGYHVSVCSNCNWRGHGDTCLIYKPKYCPNCGAKMVEPQESEDKE